MSHSTPPKIADKACMNVPTPFHVPLLMRFGTVKFAGLLVFSKNAHQKKDAVMLLP